ncbi:MAG TPA: GDSL-type esterase/lipase family protein [Candidatus Absconditabacterales bacterium]|nr:GDSL-type esterase/lipase family protein [Candidatus Absconditabacterales bacterium]
MKICIWGDSTGWGAFDKKMGGWANRLHIWGLSNDNYVYNFSISSNDTSGILYALEKEIGIINQVEPEDQYIYVFAIGSNDSRYKNTKDNKVVPIDEFRSNLQKIIDITNQVTDKIMFVGLKQIDESKTTPIPWEPTEYYENDDLAEYNKTIKEVCEKNNTFFLSIRDLLDKEDFEDGLHPNSQGHKKMYEKIKEFIKKNLLK